MQSGFFNSHKLMEEQKNTLQEIKEVLAEVKKQKKKNDRWSVILPLIGVFLGGMISFFTTAYLKNSDRRFEVQVQFEKRMSDFIISISKYKECESAFYKLDNQEGFVIRSGYIPQFYKLKSNPNFESVYQKDHAELKIDLTSKFYLLGIKDSLITKMFNKFINNKYDEMPAVLAFAVTQIDTINGKKLDYNLAAYHYEDSYYEWDNNMESEKNNIISVINLYLTENHKL